MFTIKHVEADGHESINTAESVGFMPPREDDPAHPRGVVTGFGGTCNLSGTYTMFGSGDVYVMNDSGSTVGAYHLGRAPAA